MNRKSSEQHDSDCNVIDSCEVSNVEEVIQIILDKGGLDLTKLADMSADDICEYLKSSIDLDKVDIQWLG
jgi:hypothetical protein